MLKVSAWKATGTVWNVTPSGDLSTAEPKSRRNDPSISVLKALVRWWQKFLYGLFSIPTIKWWYLGHHSTVTIFDMVSTREKWWRKSKNYNLLKKIIQGFKTAKKFSALCNSNCKVDKIFSKLMSDWVNIVSHGLRVQTVLIREVVSLWLIERIHGRKLSYYVVRRLRKCMKRKLNMTCDRWC